MSSDARKSDPQSFFQSESALPPPQADEIDVLIDAASSGVRRSSAAAPLDGGALPEPDFLSEDSTRYAIQSALQSWRYRVSAILLQRFMLRWAVPTFAAFSVGTVATVWGLRSLEAPAVVVADAAPPPTPVAAPAPVVVPSVPLPPLPSAPVLVRVRALPAPPEERIAAIPVNNLVPRRGMPMLRTTLAAVIPVVSEPVAAPPAMAPQVPTAVAAVLTRTPPPAAPRETPKVETRVATATPAPAPPPVRRPVPAAPVATVAVNRPSAPVLPAASRPAAAAPLVASTQPANVAPPTPVPTPAPLAAEPIAAPASVVASSAPAPAPVPPAVAAAAPVNEGRTRVVADRAAVRQTLDQYVDALERMNVAAAAEVWPSVDRRALTRSFAALKSQGMDFESCDVDVYDTTAVARCSGSVEFVPRIGGGSTRLAQQEWRFSMRKLSGGWKIEDVAASQSASAANRLRGSH